MLSVLIIMTFGKFLVSFSDLLQQRMRHIDADKGPCEEHVGKDVRNQIQ